jgi:hypothetical protein
MLTATCDDGKPHVECMHVQHKWMEMNILSRIPVVCMYFYFFDMQTCVHQRMPGHASSQSSTSESDEWYSDDEDTTGEAYQDASEDVQQETAETSE